MTGIIICLAVIALAEMLAVYRQYKSDHLAKEIGRLEDIVLSERKKFEEYQTNVLQEMVALRKDNTRLKELLASEQTGQVYVGTETEH